MIYKTPFVWQEGRVKTDPLLMSKFGLPWRHIEMWIDYRFPRGTLKRDILIARAYDNAYGTSTSEKYAAFDIDQELPW